MVAMKYKALFFYVCMQSASLFNAQPDLSIIRTDILFRVIDNTQNALTFEEICDYVQITTAHYFTPFGLEIIALINEHFRFKQDAPLNTSAYALTSLIIPDAPIITHLFGLVELAWLTELATHLQKHMTAQEAANDLIRKFETSLLLFNKPSENHRFFFWLFCTGGIIITATTAGILYLAHQSSTEKFDSQQKQLDALCDKVRQETESHQKSFALFTDQQKQIGELNTEINLIANRQKQLLRQQAKPTTNRNRELEQEVKKQQQELGRLKKSIAHTLDELLATESQVKKQPGLLAGIPLVGSLLSPSRSGAALTAATTRAAIKS